MTKEEFLKLKKGDLVRHKRTKTTYSILYKKAYDNVFKMINTKYLGMFDYININTCEDYDVVKENENAN